MTGETFQPQGENSQLPWLGLCGPYSNTLDLRFGFPPPLAQLVPLPESRNMIRRHCPRRVSLSRSSRLSLNHAEVIQHINHCYLATAGLWRGCDWTTSFGPHRLDLCGLKAKQTRLLEEATSGKESEAWAAATRWLEQIERDAREAQSAASSAVELLGKHQCAAALARITEACRLESRYHEELVWGPLRDLIAAAVEQGCGESKV